MLRRFKHLEELRCEWNDIAEFSDEDEYSEENDDGDEAGLDDEISRNGMDNDRGEDSGSISGSVYEDQRLSETVFDEINRREKPKFNLAGVLPRSLKHLGLRNCPAEDLVMVEELLESGQEYMSLQSIAVSPCGEKQGGLEAIATRKEIKWDQSLLGHGK